MIFSAVALAAPAASASPRRDAASPKWIPGEVVVRYRSDVSIQERASVRNAVASSFKPLRARGTELLELAPGESVTDAVAELESRSDVLYAEPNYIITASASVPNDTSFPNLWALHSSTDIDIDAPEAWDISTGSADVKVGVLDSGIDYNHPDLAANIWNNPGESLNGRDDDGNGYVDDVRGWDFAGRDADPMDVLGHGTHVAGTIGADGNNGHGITGVNWDVSLVPLRVLGDDGSGSTADAANAIVYARSIGVSVVNMSFGGPYYSRMMAEAIGASPDMLFVASAGNDGSNNDLAPTYPCNLASDNLICVAATNSSGTLASYSNYGASAVDLGAPGSYIYSTVPGGNYAWYSGTSMAAPHVAGAAALLSAVAPDATTSAIRSSLLDGATPTTALSSLTATGASLNLYRSVQLVRPAAPEPAPAPDPAPQPEPSPEPEGAPAPAPVPESDTEPAPEAAPAPEPAPEAAAPVTHSRAITLRFSGRLVAKGRVTTRDGFLGCVSGTVVKIKRNGRRIATVTTGADGSFRARLRDRAGTYKAVAVASDLDNDSCSRAVARRVY